MPSSRKGRPPRHDLYGEPLAEQLNVRVSQLMLDLLDELAMIEQSNRGDLVREAVFELIRRREQDEQWVAEKRAPYEQRRARLDQRRKSAQD